MPSNLNERVYKPVDEVLGNPPPKTIPEALMNWPDHGQYTASPADWRDEVLYFLLPDRFADANVAGPPLDRRDPVSAVANVAAARPEGLSWLDWCNSGSSRFQGGGDLFNPLAEHKVCDFCSLRALNTSNPDTLDILITIFQYWTSLTDCDGFRVDTVKHVGPGAARAWCNAVTEHAELMGKDNFFLLGEIAGGNREQAFYLMMNGSRVLELHQSLRDAQGERCKLKESRTFEG